MLSTLGFVAVHGAGPNQSSLAGYQSRYKISETYLSACSSLPSLPALPCKTNQEKHSCVYAYMPPSLLGFLSCIGRGAQETFRHEDLSIIIWEIKAGKWNSGMRSKMTYKSGTEIQRRFVELQCCRSSHRGCSTLCYNCSVASFRTGQSTGT